MDTLRQSPNVDLQGRDCRARFPSLAVRYFLFALSLLVPVQLRASSSDRPAFLVQASPIANLVYQLDCLSGSIHCSQDAYEHLWKSELLWDHEDQTELDKWKEIREKYHGELVLQEPKHAPLALPWNGEEGVQLDEKFLIAAFHATDATSLREAWEVLVAPRDLSGLERVIAHFQPRFASWWKRAAASESDRFRSEMQTVLQGKAIESTVESFSHFYGANLQSDYPIYFNLIFRPAFRDTHTQGTQMENHAVVEFLPGEDVSKRLTIVLHELCHFFYSSVQDAKKQDLTRAFADSPDPAAMAGWALLNETLATALGNGIASQQLRPAAFEKDLQTKLSFYNDVAIDSAAKASLPLLREWIARRGTLYDQAFPSRYLMALRDGMPELLMMPASLLTEVTILYDRAFASVVLDDVRSLHGGIYPAEGIEREASWSMMRTYPKLNAVVFVSQKSLPQLEKYPEVVSPRDLRAMTRAARGGQTWVYSIERYPSTYLFVIGGHDGKDIASGFSRLMHAQRRFTGLLEKYPLHRQGDWNAPSHSIPQGLSPT